MKFEEHCPDGQKCYANTTGCLAGECQQFKSRSMIECADNEGTIRGVLVYGQPNMDSHEHAMQLVNKLAFENGRMHFLLGEAITSMSHAEVFIGSREKMHPEGRRQWGELIDRMREVLEPAQECSNESARLEGGQ